ncbi:UTP20 [Candida pseudojiufengensis]|uniref:UTP20 n=1 Tax=Candida pseudojiufengensis TaxID=497109 RepID=UPI002223FC03|nr:UTP20 [Candida pseudojiufengensis]KAI5959627.1 UTP20 [Candida pseudojiufengensis]
MPKNKTTESSRRHGFVSFKERVDSIKIEPSKRLNKRVYDDVESSHTLSTLEHWQELNLSGTFTGLIDDIIDSCQSLPQVIHHKDKIYEAIYEAIKSNDIHSLQPLFEVLSQFIHDLGPDFLPYYPKTLNLISEIVLTVNPNDLQNSRNSSNALDWAFSTLAFTFKYLVKYLTEDLIPTFSELIPLLKLTNKQYISRFCAESLSFLVRKSSPDVVRSFIRYALYDQVDAIMTNANYLESIKIIFSESMKNTKGTFHTKSRTILTIILDCVINEIHTEAQSKIVSLLSDILLDVLHHGEAEACESFYNLISEELSRLIQENQDEVVLLMSCQILSTLCFTDSGKKVSNWSKILQLIDQIIVLMQTKESISIELNESIVYLLSVVFRNVPTQALIKYQKRFIDNIMVINNGAGFLPFMFSGLNNKYSKLSEFGINSYIQDYMNKFSDDEEVFKREAFFLEISKETKFSFPNSTANKLVGTLLDDIEHQRFFDISWKLILIKHSKNIKVDETILSKLLFESPDTTLGNELVCLTMYLLMPILTSSSHILNEMVEFFVNNFKRFQKSKSFLPALSELIKLSENSKIFMDNVLNCLLLPSHQSKSDAIELIELILRLNNEAVSETLSQIKIIEEIPLSLHTGRDLTLRIRNLANSFQKEISPSKFDKILISKYFFGLLSNKFQPSWKAVFEALPTISSSCKSELWENAYTLLTMDYYNETSTNGFEDEKFSNLIDWQPQSTKLIQNFEFYETNYLGPFRNINASISNLCNAACNGNSFEVMLRSNVLHALQASPDIVNQSELVDLFLGQGQNSENFQNWSKNDKNDSLVLISKLKNLRKLKDSEKLYARMLSLLSSSYSKVQQLSLDVIFAFHDPIINKYRDNLKNLLDDVTFSDEISKFTDLNSPFEIEDKSHIMPLVIRILFGKVQGKPSSKSKLGYRNAALSSLPNFNDADIISFINIGSEKLNYEDYFEGRAPLASLGLVKGELNKITGYMNLLHQMYELLSKNYASVLSVTIEPLIYSLLAAQNRLDCSSDIVADVEEKDDEEIVGVKMAKSIRSIGMRNLKELFTILGPDFNWKNYVQVISNNLIQPRLNNFANENSQQPSAALLLICSWINQFNTLPFLFANDFEPVKAVLSILEKKDAKESVVSEVLDFAIKALEKKNESNDDYYTLLAIVVDSLLQTLPITIDRIYNRDVGSKAIRILLLMIEGEYIDTNESKSVLINSLTFALEKSNQHIDLKDKANILISLSSLIGSYECSFEDIEPLYLACSKLLRIFPTREIRETLSTLFVSFGLKFHELKLVSELISDLNAYTTRMSEYDFEKRLNAFKLINEEYYKSFDVLQWTPLVNAGLFFINDPTELVIRENATFMLKRFVDCYNSKTTFEEAAPYIHLLKDTILPILRVGLRKENEDIQSEYVSLLEYIVQEDKFFNELSDMQILIGDDEDEESQFFKNINHIQLHLRQRSIRRLLEHRGKLNDNSISHYILPLLEKYAVSKEEKFRNIGLESLEAIKVLAESVSWNQYKAIFKRYISGLKLETDVLRQKVNLIVAISTVLKELKMLSMQDEFDKFVLMEILPTLTKILQVRDDNTIVARAPLAEAAINLIMCITPEKINDELPKVLTNLCQVMRSRSEELRDAVRKTLGKITTSLGSHYLIFILKELQTALSRGSQIHVLSFTTNYLLQCLSKELKHGDLNESVPLVMNVVMEDIFGAAGQEKDADGYTSKMKEVKFKKSFDTCEILASNITLNEFGELIAPIRLLLKEVVNHKVQVKLDEVLRKLSMGLHHNVDASNVKILHLCYEIFMMSIDNEEEKEKLISATEAHFLTVLDRKVKTHIDKSIYKQTMQKLSLELLRTAISRHESLLNTSNMKGFIPLLTTAIYSENEGVILASLKVLSIVVRLPFDEETQNILKTCVRKALIIIKDSPTTNSDIVQSALKFLATTIKHNPKVVLKESAISYVLSRIQPDLEEPNRQGLAFQFLKAVVSQHLMLPEIYDIMESVSKLMIVNHTKEIRDMSRSVYFQFLMEYDQSKGRLEKQFKFLVNNLSYPTEEGRQSVMELIHLIIMKAGKDLLEKLNSSFFIALSNVLIMDSSARSREMASSLLINLMKKVKNIKFMEDYCSGWLKQSKVLLKRCGFQIYKLIISVFGYKHNEQLNKLVLDNIQAILKDAQFSDEGNDVEWELIYSALSAFSSIASDVKDQTFEAKFQTIWVSIIDCLLYPHSWIRLICCKLISIPLANLDKSKIKGAQLELIMIKLIHQLRTPSLSEELGNVCIKNLVFIAIKWEANDTYIENESNDKIHANDFLVNKICGVIKQENFQSIIAKKMSIKFLNLFLQVISGSKSIKISEKIIAALYNFTDSEYARTMESDELTNLSLETLNLIKEKIGITEYTSLFAKIKQEVDARRRSRKAKKAQLTLNAPVIAAKRNFKKHERFREKRKNERDENGYYKSKKKRVI